MQSLVRRSRKSAETTVQSELRQAGVNTVQTMFLRGVRPEVASSIVGVLRFANEHDTTVAFVRWGRFWEVRSSTKLPLTQAVMLNERYRGSVRVAGSAEGQDVAAGGCGHWQVDGQSGLNELVRVLKGTFGSQHSRLPLLARLLQLKLIDENVYG